MLFRLAAFATETLTDLCEKKPEMFSPIAAHQITWPLNTSLHKGLLEKNELLLKKLTLASATGINISKDRRPFSFDAPATRIALEHYRFARAFQRAPMAEWNLDEWMMTFYVCKSFTAERLQKLESWGQNGAGKSLPLLSKSTALQWKREFRAFFRLVHGDHFDECPELKELRDAVFESAKDNEGRVGGAGVVRNRMLAATRQAISSIAAGAKVAKESIGMAA